MPRPEQLQVPGIAKPEPARPLDVVRWIESVRTRMVNHLRAELDVLSKHGRVSAEDLAQYREAERLLAEIDGDMERV